MTAAIVLLLAMRLMIPNDWDATAFLAFGDESVEQTDYAESLLGSVVKRAKQGHDGKFFFIQALDPLYLSPDVHAVHLDRPVYRGQRMLYPLLAGAFGLVPVTVLPWTMLAMNLAGLVAGSVLVGRLAVHRGGSRWLGLAFGLNVGLIAELYVGGAGIVALALVASAALALERGHVAAAAFAASGAALSREVMLLAVAGLAYAWWRRHRHVPYLLMAVPLIAVGVWAVYLRLRLGWSSGLQEVQELTLVPFSGLIEASSRWREDPADLVVVAVVVLLVLRFVTLVPRSNSFLTWATVGFVALAPFLTAQVWTQYFDIARAVAPVLTAYVVEVFSRRSLGTKPVVSPGSL